MTTQKTTSTSPSLPQKRVVSSCLRSFSKNCVHGFEAAPYMHPVCDTVSNSQPKHWRGTEVPLGSTPGHRSCSALGPPSRRETGASCVTGSDWSAPCLASPQKSEYRSQGNKRNSLCAAQGLPCCLAGRWVLFPSGAQQHYFQHIFDNDFCFSTGFF